MNIEELQAQIEELRTELDNKAARIGELSKENAKWRRQAQGKDAIDPDEYAKVTEELETLRAEYGKVTKQTKAEIERLAKERDALHGDLSSVLVDGGLTQALVKNGVRPELMDAAAALLRQQVKLNGRDALMGEKPLAEAVAEWVAGDQGKHFAAAPANTGAGATGGNGAPAIAPKGNLLGDRTQRANAIAARFPELPTS